ncbi:DUF7017 domain-containing protein [Belliella kenyensis]|uniref:DUF7017 domain-containing protein n=1 Tax=Belliella kenyensis TaxID=1472724 RepID=A0ABV8EU06_9BACT|nr:hypothetical protein [Belliella kenyensis]MCH7402126.1 hypothetical protein [Belliella kenyensis]MDN3601641.1 hypothetical protein [Belliella kenyensis]
MNQQHLKQLRAENRFEESYKLTRNELANRKHDIWARRNHSWSIYYLIKKHVQAGQTSQAKNYLSEFLALQMPDDEKLLYERMNYFQKVLDQGYLHVKQLVTEGKFEQAFELELKNESPDVEQLSWIVYYTLRSFNKDTKANLSLTKKLLHGLMERYKPSKKLVSRLLLQELVKTPPEFWINENQSIFLEKAGFFDILEEDDFQKQEWEGKKIISLAERLHISYSKALLRENAPEEKILNYIQELVEPILEKYPAMLYVPYFKAKLLLGTGDKQAGVRSFLPFAKKKASEFWVWQVFAEAYEAQDDLYFSCLCKAMTCRTKPEFLLNIQEKLISYLIAKEQYAGAKSELEKMIKLREQHGWGMRSYHRKYLEAQWYVGKVSMPVRYQENLSKAEALLGIKPDKKLSVIVYHVNREKKTFSFLVENGKAGFGKYTQKPELWKVYVLEGSFSKGDFFQVKHFTAHSTQEHALLQSVTGKFTKQDHNPFGFVDGKFVDPRLTKEWNLKHNDWIKGKAVLAPVKGKREWAWKMIDLQKTEKNE